jgi:transcriptional regulator with XRE-family HTH domain
MENLVRSLRIALGLSQHKFADLLGCSHGSIQVYEAGRTVTPEMLDRMVAVAVENNLGSLATALKQQYGWPAPSHQTTAKDWHQMLDFILRNGDEHTTAAVQSSLVLSFNYASARKGKRK